MAQRVVIPGFRKIETSSGGGEGGTTNYNDLTNKPSINNVPLVGNLNTANLKLTDKTLTEEGVPADAKTVGAKLAEQSTSLIALSEQLGNHTVKSDVPENAVFTDTVYNDKDIKAEIAKKADATAVPSKVSELTNDSNYQTAEQVNSTVVTEIAKVVADAPEDLNTLKEMSDWIAGHENDASAMNSAISDNKTAITALQTGKADKREIPTTLPANGGNSDTVNNHTVESDVPVDAVFTDTIYDDTEVKESIEELSSNLDTLTYGENAGGKNLIFTDELVGKKLSITQDIGGIAPNGDTITFSISTTTNDDMDNSKSVLYIMRTDGTNSTPVNNGQALTLTDDDKNNFLGYRVNVIPSLEGKIVKSIQVEVGTTATPYEPYIPSVKMLAEEVSAQNESLADYGLTNIFDGNVLQGYYDVTDGIFHIDNYNVCCANKISCDAGQNIHIIINKSLYVRVIFYNSSGEFIGSENFGEKTGTEFSCKAIPNAKYFTFYASNNGTSIPTVEEAKQYRVYINNAIDELKGDLNTLEFGEIAGGKNLFKGNFIEKVLDTGINYTDVDLSKEQNTIKDIKGIVFAVFGAYLKKGTYTFSYTNDAYFSLNRVAIAGTDCVLAAESIRKSYTWTQNTDGWTYFGIEGDDSETGVTDTPFSVTPDIQIEEGTQATAYEPYAPSIKMLADEVSEQNESLCDLENAINGLNDDNYWEQGTWNILGQKVDEPTIIRMKEKLILPIDYSVSLVNSNYVYEVDYYENGAYKNDTDWISGSIVIPNGQEFVLLIRKVDNSSLVPTERNAISVLPKNIGTINDKLKNDLAPKKIELQNVDERVTIQDNGSFIVNGFAFVNLLVTFNETLPQWSNFVRLPRPKGDNISVHCENSVILAIYSQDNLPGDCGTTESVASGTEIRLLANYEVA